ncbi:hypothetical protein CC86DRAFT_471309 [Ophiobolus disseminans]|uniref:Zn(2)-C6 fungal-type domain-containing protein n=1 Tax=Ophiobolus disseminans TaxID=1469910 RepID=A0A6A6ZH07_9PLEO|nr:hypothetical protein CC86DRAFT_471309 [Ophiobolus disseminans]
MFQMAHRNSGEQYSSYLTTKRARQACENCRRKKSKCSGEQPECSFCVRLRQKCVYARHHRVRSDRDRDRNEHMREPVAEALTTTDALVNSDRLREIEGKLEQLAAAIGSTRPASSHAPSAQTLASSEPTASYSSWPSVVPPSPNSLLGGSAPALSKFSQQITLPDAVVEDGVTLYFENYCNQPCPIASYYKTSAMAIDGIPIIVLAPMLALSLRSSRHSFFNTESRKRNQLNRLSQLSWGLLAKAYGDFDLDDAYFEGLCLLALVDSGEGHYERARAQVSFGLRITQSRGMLSAKRFNSLDAAATSRRQEIVWTLFMLDRMLLGGHTRDPSVLSTSFELPMFSDGPSKPDLVSRAAGLDALDMMFGPEASQPSPSVIQLNIEILSIWESVLADITKPPTDTDTPIWRHDSGRAAVLTKLMDFETRCQRGHHGYMSVGSPTRVLEESQLHDYFLAWIFYQLVHCVIHCCLNHPFIIYVKTIRIKHQIPVTFLQKSYEYSMIHANWVFRLLNEMDDANLVIHDPFIGHMVAIAASIHLEHTLSQHHTVASSAKQKFDKCLNFVTRAAQEWPSMLVAASLLEKLQSRLVHRSNMNYVEDEYDGAAPSSSPRQVSLGDEDMQLMWMLFDLPSKSTRMHELSAESEYTSNMEDVPFCDQTGSAEQDPTTRFLSRMDDPNLANIAGGTLSGLGSPEASYRDWSLFGRSWADNIPGDLAANDPMMVGSIYQW